MIEQTAAFQKTNQSQNLTSTGKTESASQNSTQDLLKSPSWKTSPEEDALEKLTANAHTCTNLYVLLVIDLAVLKEALLNSFQLSQRHTKL